MIWYFFKSAFRYLKKNKVHTFIHLIGLSIGFAAVLIISLFVHKELSFDTFHANKDRIYRTYSKKAENEFAPGVSGPLASWARNKLPEVENATKLTDVFGYGYVDNFISFKESSFQLKQPVLLADPEFNNVFTFPGVIGNIGDALKQPESIVLTESLSKKLFGDEQPLGKKIKLMNQFALTVNAIIKDTPSNSSIYFDALISMTSINSLTSGRFSDEKWNYSGFDTYFLLKKGAERNVVAKKVQQGITDNNSYLKEHMSENTISLLPVTDIYYSHGSQTDFVKHGNKIFTFILLGIAMVIFFLAVLNFMNLSIGTALSRSKEVGISSFIGAGRLYICLRVIIESVFLNLGAGLAAILIVWLILPWFNLMFQVGLTYNSLFNLSTILIVLLVCITSGIINGLFPALYVSRLNIKESTNIRLGGLKKDSGFRYFLVVFQFAASSVLIICSLFILNQIQYMKNKDLGFDKENIIVVDLDKALGLKKDILRSKLTGNAYITKVGFSSSLPGGITSRWGEQPFIDEGEEKKLDINLISADPDFLELLGLRFIAGTNLPEQPRKQTMYMVLNESAAKRLNDPLNAKLKWGDSEITGIVQDFHFSSLHDHITPFVFNYMNTEEAPEKIKAQYMPRKATIKIASSDPKEIASTIKFIKRNFNEVSPGSPFEFSFFDSYLNSLYIKEVRMSGIISAFTFLAFFIAALGLFGMAVYSTQSRTKEIGIRKVNGAKVSEILTMLNKDFVKWVVIAFVIATPIAWYAMHKWLENFAYKTELSWWIFALAGLLALGIALLTVSWQSWKAATRNPVEALRYE